MPFTNVFDDTFPPDTQLANLLGDDIRKFKVDIQERMAAISGLDAAKPAFGSDTQPAKWNGILFFATDTGKIYQFNNPSWTDITATFRTPLTTKFYDPTDVSISANGDGNSITIPANTLIGGSGPSNGSIIKINAILKVTAATGNVNASLFFGGANLETVIIASSLAGNYFTFEATGIVVANFNQRFMTNVFGPGVSQPTVGASYTQPAIVDITAPIVVKTSCTIVATATVQFRGLTVQIL